MSEIELIIRIMLANARYYGTTSTIEFNQKHINEIVPKLNDLFCKYGYKSEIFFKDEKNSTYKNYINLMLSIFGDVIYEDGRPYNEDWFGLYDEETESLDFIHLSYAKAEKWISLSSRYNQDFIEMGSYILTDDIEVFEADRERLEDHYLKLKM